MHNHVKIVAVDDGWAQVEVEIHPETLNRWGTPHGGILFTLSDVACGMAILTTRMEACVTRQHHHRLSAPGPCLRQAHRHRTGAEGGRQAGFLRFRDS